MLNRRNNLLTLVDPFETMANIGGNVFDSPFFSEDTFSTFGSFGTDITDEGDSYLLTADLPGFEKDDIHIDVKHGYLTVSAERHSEHEDKDKKGKFIRKERSYGSYRRSFPVDGIDEKKISAKYDNGILSVSLPKLEKQTDEKGIIVNID